MKRFLMSCFAALTALAAKAEELVAAFISPPDDQKPLRTSVAVFGIISPSCG